MSVRKRRQKWWVDFCFQRTRYRKASPDNSRAGALLYEQMLKQKLAKGESLDPAAEDMPFARFARQWFTTYVRTNNKHSEIITKEMILRVHLIPYFGPKELTQIRTLDIEQYKAQKIEQGLSFKSINNHLAVLRKSLQCALEWELIEKRPLIKRLTLPPQQHDFLSVEECQHLIRAAEGWWQVMLIVAIGTGMRFGELIALRWQDVDFASGTLSVTQAYAKGVLGSPKNNRIRIIPLSNAVGQALLSIQKTKGLVFSYGDNVPLTQYASREPHLLG